VSHTKQILVGTAFVAVATLAVSGVANASGHDRHRHSSDGLSIAGLHLGEVVDDVVGIVRDVL
jgi:hypothetical protein